jgi:putative glutamine amidotransferase
MKRVCVVLLVVIVVGGAGCHSMATAPAPLIGITSVYKTFEDDPAAYTQTNFAYVRAIADNGGVPVVLPTVDDAAILRRYIKELDGLVLVGGADIPPSAYGETPHETVEPLTSQRYEFERKLIASWLASDKPILGVCLGMQFSNVVSGGSLIQDIPSEVGTEVNHKKYHRVRIAPDSSLAELLGASEARVLSSHHQAVDEAGAGMEVVAWSDDGVQEATERIDGGFGLFVQWHPESGDDRQQRDAIYGALVRAATKQR